MNSQCFVDSRRTGRLPEELIFDSKLTTYAHLGQLIVRFQKRAHNPLLLAAGFDKIQASIPWLDGKRLRLILA